MKYSSLFKKLIKQVCEGIRKGQNRDFVDQMKEFGVMKWQVTYIYIDVI